MVYGPWYDSSNGVTRSFVVNVVPLTPNYFSSLNGSYVNHHLTLVSSPNPMYLSLSHQTPHWTLKILSFPFTS